LVWRKRPFIKIILFLIIFLAILWLVYWSPTVQKMIYPIPHERYVFGYAAVYGLDPYLVAAVIRAESSFAHEAESGSGARGLMQIMPDTAKWAAEQMQIDFDPEMLFKPKYNIRIGCWYLRELFNSFGGNLIVVLAAYNAGQGKVSRWLDEGLWTGSKDDLDRIPFGETRTYIKRVLNNYQRYQDIYTENEVP